MTLPEYGRDWRMNHNSKIDSQIFKTLHFTLLGMMKEHDFPLFNWLVTDSVTKGWVPKLLPFLPRLLLWARLYRASGSLCLQSQPEQWGITDPYSLV